MKLVLSITVVSFLALSTPLTSFGATVFSDTFGSGSTINNGTADPTGNSAAYQTWAQGAAPANFSIASGALHFEARNTASVFTEVQTLFTTSPIALTSIGDSLSLTLVFTDTSHVLLSAQNASAQLDIGLYNAGGVKPLAGARFDSGTASTGGAAGYTGYIGRLFLNGNANVITRPVQSGGANSSDQDLLFNNAGGGAFNSPTATQIGSTTATGFTTGLTQGSQYTVQLTLTLDTLTTLSIAESLFDGVGTGGTLLASQTASATGATLVATSFDALALGWRHTGATEASSLDINSITIDSNIAVPEPTTMALAGLGLLGLVTAYRRQRK